LRKKCTATTQHSALCTLTHRHCPRRRRRHLVHRGQTQHPVRQLQHTPNHQGRNRVGSQACRVAGAPRCSRAARAHRVSKPRSAFSMEGNARLCRGLLVTRCGDTGPPHCKSSPSSAAPRTTSWSATRSAPARPTASQRPSGIACGSNGLANKAASPWWAPGDDCERAAGALWMTSSPPLGQ
jgi:hypothetical protein